MELQISYRVCAKIPEKGILQRETTGSGKDPERAVRVEKDKNSRGMYGKRLTFARNMSAL